MVSDIGGRVVNGFEDGVFIINVVGGGKIEIINEISVYVGENVIV